MIVWGAILGAGIFTFIPHITFYLLYIYLGFFHGFSEGVVFGAIYGISRGLPSIIIANNVNKTQDFDFKLTNLFKRLGKMVTLFSLVICMFILFL